MNRLKIQYLLYNMAIGYTTVVKIIRELQILYMYRCDRIKCPTIKKNISLSHVKLRIKKLFYFKYRFLINPFNSTHLV